MSHEHGSTGSTDEAVEATRFLTPEQLHRYARHLALPGFDAAKQKALVDSSVLVIGAGGLGSPVVLYLAAAGVGHITVIDDDVVDESNLQRQVIHRQQDVGRAKADSACDAVARLNPQISARSITERLTSENALSLVGEHDVVVDASDNFATRYLVNDAAQATTTPLVWGSILQFGGQMSVFCPTRGPMLRDLYPEVPASDSVPSSEQGGVFGPLVGVVGTMMAVETIKVLTGIGTPAIGRLMVVDSLNLSCRTLRFYPDPDRMA